MCSSITRIVQLELPENFENVLKDCIRTNKQDSKTSLQNEQPHVEKIPGFAAQVAAVEGQ